MLWCEHVSTFVILSPTDNQSILAELQSPAALRSDPHFLEPDIPITPNPSLAPHQPEPDPLLLTRSQSQTLPWSPEVEPSCTDPNDDPPRSPPRPSELTLSITSFEFPITVPPKVRKPHIALNDQLLLSEEEDRSCHEMELSHKPRSPSFPTMCDLDFDMAFSTSSPSLSSVSSLTPSSPERAQRGDTGAPMGVPERLHDDVGLRRGEKKVAEETRKVVEMVGADSVGRNTLVGQWVETDLIKNVERKCELVTKDICKFSDDSGVIVTQKEVSAEEVQHELVQDGIEEKTCKDEEEGKCSMGKCCETIEIVTVKESVDEILVVKKVDVGSSERLNEKEMDDSNGEMPLKDNEGLFGNERTVKNQTVDYLSPKAWVEVLGGYSSSESGSNEDEEEEVGHKDVQIKKDSLENLQKEAKNDKEGTEEKEEDGETTEVQEKSVPVEQAEKDVCSLSGWHSESSSINVEPPTQARSVSSDLLDRRER